MELSIEMKSPVYTTLVARPIRLGVLVPDIQGLPWQTVFRGALSSQVRIWGGTANLVFPLGKETKDSPLFWALAELLDPDTWMVYGSSYRELETLDRDVYADWRRELSTHLATLPEEDRPQALADAHAEWLSIVAIPDDLEDLLVARGAPLNKDGRMLLRGPLSGTGEPPYPCVDPLALGSLPPEIIDREFDDSPTLQLLSAAEFGPVSPDLRDALGARSVERQVKRPQSRLSLVRSLYGAPGDRPEPGAFALAEAGLTWFRPRPLVQDRVTVVAGESSWDFALAYALRRAGTHAFWMPDSVFREDAERDTAHRSVVRLAERMGAPLVVTAASNDGSGTALVESFARHRRSAVISSVSWHEAIPPRANRLLIGNRVGRPEAAHLDDGITPLLRTPIPDVSDDPLKLRWMTELEVRGWAAARHQGLARHLVDAGSWNDARITQNGIAYESVSGMIPYGTPLEHLTVHPQLHPLPLLQQLQILAAESQWTCELSEKGRFAIAAASLFGGFPELAAALQDDDVAQILFAYLDGDREAVGIPLRDRRRYLSLADFRALDLAQPPELVLEQLRSRRIVQAGVILKCERCRHAGWYRPRDLDPAFSCTRCGLSQIPNRNSWLQDAEPAWRYRLDEVVLQFARHRGDLPVLVAFERFDRSRETTQYVPEITLRDPDGRACEVDFAVTESSALWLGEAFSDARYAQGRRETDRLQRLAEVVGVLNARGTILATSAEDLASETQANARAILPTDWLKIEFKSRAFHLRRPVRLLDDDRGSVLDETTSA